MTNIRVETDADGIVTLTWDMPGRSMNVLSEDSIGEYVAAADVETHRYAGLLRPRIDRIPVPVKYRRQAEILRRRAEIPGRQRRHNSK